MPVVYMAKYESDEIERALKGHDWKYKAKLKVSGTKGDSKYLSVDKMTMMKLKELLRK